MPKNKVQGFIFGVIMSYAMAFGMEIYNTAINHGFHLADGSFSAMTNTVFLDAFREMTFMGLFVILFSNLWGNRLGAAFAAAPFTHWLFGKIFPGHWLSAKNYSRISR